MARVLTCGFEGGSLPADVMITGIFDSGLGSSPFAYSTARVRSGQRSLQLLGGNPQTAGAHAGSTTTNTYYGRIAFNVASYDSGGSVLYLLLMASSGSGTGFQVAINTDGSASLQNYSTNADVAVLSGKPFATLNTWYVLEASYQPSTGATVVRLNGVQVAAGTCETATDCFIYTANTPNTCSIFLDDWACNDSTGAAQNSWCGPGQIVMLLPTADSSRAGFTNGAGATTNLWDAVNNTPPTGVVQTSASATTQIKDNTNITTDTYVATLQSYTAAGVPAGATVTVTQSFVLHGNSTTTPRNAGLASSNPTVSEAIQATGATAAATFPTGWGGFGTSLQYGPTVTLGTAPTVTYRKAVASTDYAMATMMGIIAEYVPAPAAQILDCV